MVSFSRVAFGSTLPNAKSIHQKAFLKSSAAEQAKLIQQQEQSHLRSVAHDAAGWMGYGVGFIGLLTALGTLAGGAISAAPLGVVGSAIAATSLTFAKAGFFTGLASRFLGSVFNGDALTKEAAIQRLEKKVNEITQAEPKPAS